MRAANETDEQFVRRDRNGCYVIGPREKARALVKGRFETLGDRSGEPRALSPSQN